MTRKQAMMNTGDDVKTSDVGRTACDDGETSVDVKKKSCRDDMMT
jgi:hypothetical protein